MMNIKTIAGAVLVMAFSAGAAQAAYTPTITTTGNNFTMLDPGNGITGGTNDVTFTWDGSYRTAVVRDNSINATITSPTPFFGSPWYAHNVNIYAPGSYTFNAGCPSGDAGCGVGPSYNMTVGIGQVGAHMLFNWSVNQNIDVVILWDMKKPWADAGPTSPFVSGGGNTGLTVWDGVSIDTDMDIDTIHGTKMIDGPFTGFSANFNVNGIKPVPVPAAAWLLGSGLVGLVGVARRKIAA